VPGLERRVEGSAIANQKYQIVNHKSSGAGYLIFSI
jgi:hypothetical protein